MQLTEGLRNQFKFSYTLKIANSKETKIQLYKTLIIDR